MSVEKKLLHYVGQAIQHYQLVQAGDRLLIGLSGGKDSWTLLNLFRELQKRAKISFHLKVAIVDFGFVDNQPLTNWLEAEKVEYVVLKAQIAFGEANSKTPCVLCSRLRRGMLYSYARKQQFNKLALGHHRDDLNVSLLMSIFYNGKIASMPPKWEAEGVTVIRPMVYCQEQDIIKYAAYKKFPILSSRCPLKNRLSSREQVGLWLKKLAQENPKIGSNILRAMQNLHPDHLADRRWHPFHEEHGKINR